MNDVCLCENCLEHILEELWCADCRNCDRCCECEDECDGVDCTCHTSKEDE